ncbi:type II secretion system minor pseudopilin GspI [Marinobacter sp. CHS3-4]|uniref:type II secretion system minor pseudopilin GspI n=1 Tax=Marinobacter sp. CHS3-4 TaxID=3045174 RepID=UPI0024B5AA78|nr:type II secretion system minor pseudopilin GspI [Marinobacter sp. CHS3-4]MDI9245297.1 type II secretion system minor pseudopilin GspI [Marinobacter sp. CHS3-4]
MRKAQGFTLIEVLVALLVFSIIATVAAQMSSQYISTYERVRDKTLAGWLADNQINELRLQEAAPSVSQTTEDLDYGPSRWRVETTVLNTQDPAIRRVEVSVSKFRGDGSEPAQLHSLSAFVGTQ